MRCVPGLMLGDRVSGVDEIAVQCRVLRALGGRRQTQGLAFRDHGHLLSVSAETAAGTQVNPLVTSVASKLLRSQKAVKGLSGPTPAPSRITSRSPFLGSAARSRARVRFPSDAHFRHALAWQFRIAHPSSFPERATTVR